MSLLSFDRVKETTTTTGTGTLTLAGAVSGFRAFSSVLAAGDLCYYTIVGGTEWEVGLGTYNTTLARTTVYASSNAGSLVSLSAGTKDVFITAPAQRFYDPMWMMLTANYTLTSSTSEQKAFNTTTNGTLELPTGVYEFDTFLGLASMSATSGNLAFDPVGAGTAVTDRWGWQAWGADATVLTNVAARTGIGAVTQQTSTNLLNASTNTGAHFTATGLFRISTGGTIIPSVTLTTAAAAVVNAGSYFKIQKVGESDQTYHGDWT